MAAVRPAGPFPGDRFIGERLPGDAPDEFLGAWGGEVLRGATLSRDGLHPAALIRFALFHRNYGVALIDLQPDEVPEAAARFRRAYAARFKGPVPPVVYRAFSAADLWRLTVLLDFAFSGQPAPLGEEWLDRARALLAGPPIPVVSLVGRPAAASAPGAPVPVGTGAAVSGRAVPEARAPGVAVPEVPVVEVPVVEVPVPRASVPRASVPRASVPRASVPDAAVPDAAVPEAALPGRAAPDRDLGAPGGRFSGTAPAVAPEPASAALRRPGPARRALPFAALLLAGVGGAAWMAQSGGEGSRDGPRSASSGKAGLPDAVPAGGEALREVAAAVPRESPSVGPREDVPAVSRKDAMAVPPEVAGVETREAGTWEALPAKPGGSARAGSGGSPATEARADSVAKGAGDVAAEPREGVAAEPREGVAAEPRRDGLAEAGGLSVTPGEHAASGTREPVPEGNPSSPATVPVLGAPVDGTPVAPPLPVAGVSPPREGAAMPSLAVPPPPPARVAPAGLPVGVSPPAALPALEGRPPAQPVEVAPPPGLPAIGGPVASAPALTLAPTLAPTPGLAPVAEPAAVPAPLPVPVEGGPAAPAAASAVPAPRPPPGPVAPAMLAALVRRGDAMMALGDVSAARLLYERAAAGGSAAAAMALARSHDPAVLATLQVRGLRGDPALAASWYRRAAALGDPEAGGMAQRLAAGLPEGGRVP